MGEHVRADRDQLAAMAARLDESTDGLRQAAKSDAPMPEVSVSADFVGHTLAELTKTIGALTAAVQHTASEIHAGNGSYGEVDNAAIDHLQFADRGEGAR